MQNLPQDILTKTFEEAMTELEQIVKELEIGKESLDDSIKKYQRAHHLKIYCLERLKNARLTVEKIVEQDDGTITLVDENSII